MDLATNRRYNLRPRSKETVSSQSVSLDIEPKRKKRKRRSPTDDDFSSGREEAEQTERSIQNGRTEEIGASYDRDNPRSPKRKHSATNLPSPLSPKPGTRSKRRGAKRQDRQNERNPTVSTPETSTVGPLLSPSSSIGERVIEAAQVESNETIVGQAVEHGSSLIHILSEIDEHSRACDKSLTTPVSSPENLEVPKEIQNANIIFPTTTDEIGGSAFSRPPTFTADDRHNRQTLQTPFQYNSPTVSSRQRALKDDKLPAIRRKLDYEQQEGASVSATNPFHDFVNTVITATQEQSSNQALESPSDASTSIAVLQAGDTGVETPATPQVEVDSNLDMHEIIEGLYLGSCARMFHIN